MKTTGIVRKIDELGRLVIPKELRNTLDIQEKDPLEIFVDATSIVLRKYSPACIFCGEAEAVTSHLGKNICPHCLSKLCQADDPLKSSTPAGGAAPLDEPPER